MTQFLLKCVCGDCQHRWEEAAKARPDGKIDFAGGCPRCGGTPKSIQRTTASWPKGRVFVTSEVPAPVKPPHILEADW